MVAVQLKSSPLKRGYYVIHEIQTETPVSSGTRFLARSHLWRPPTDVYETEEAIIVRVEVAGMEEDEFSIVLDGSTLVVRGVRRDVPERRAYHQMEIHFGEFASEVELHHSVAVEKAEATYHGGFLRVYLPKTPVRKVNVD